MNHTSIRASAADANDAGTAGAPLPKIVPSCRILLGYGSCCRLSMLHDVKPAVPLLPPLSAKKRVGFRSSGATYRCDMCWLMWNDVSSFLYQA